MIPFVYTIFPGNTAGNRLNDSRTLMLSDLNTFSEQSVKAPDRKKRTDEKTVGSN